MTWSVLEKPLPENAKLYLLLSTGTEEGGFLTRGARCSFQQNFKKTNHKMPSQMAASAQFFESQKKKGPGGGRKKKVFRRRGNATSVFDGTAISGYARESMLVSSGSHSSSSFV
jgi:hypothetical protein